MAVTAYRDGYFARFLLACRGGSGAGRMDYPAVPTADSSNNKSGDKRGDVLLRTVTIPHLRIPTIYRRRKPGMGMLVVRLSQKWTINLYWPSIRNHLQPDSPLTEDRFDTSLPPGAGTKTFKAFPPGSNHDAQSVASQASRYWELGISKRGESGDEKNPQNVCG